MAHTDSTPETQRLDKWLWAVRFFKTRQLAVEAINGGKVHVNGNRAKPGKEIAVGTRITITKEPHRWDITVQSLQKQRRPANEAQLCYEETEQSRILRMTDIEQRQKQRELGLLEADARPNKRERRLIHRFKRAATEE